MCAWTPPQRRSMLRLRGSVGAWASEQMRIHDLGHELALLVAYNQKNRDAQAAVERESATCEGFAITPDARWRESLKTNP
jgi:hypothetical protein